MTASTSSKPGAVRSMLSDSILRTAGLLVVSQGAVAIVGFLFWLASARIASADAVGDATTLVSASSLIAFLSTFGINATILRFLPTSEDPDAELSSGFIVCFVGALLIALGYVELLPVIAPKLGFVEHSTLYTIEFVVFTAFGALNLLTDAVFVVRQQARLIFVSDGVVQGIVKVGAPFVLIASGVYAHYGALGIFSSFGAASTADVVISVVLIVRVLGYHPELRVRWSALTRSLRYTVISYLVTVLDTLPTLILPTIVLDGLGSRPAGYFYIAFQVAAVLSGVGVSVAVSALAEGAQVDALLDEVVLRTRRILVLALPPIVIVGVAASPWVLFIFGGDYRKHASATFLVLVLAVPAVALCQLTRTLLQITKQLPSLLISQFLYALVILTLSIATVHKGIVWVAGAFLLGNLVAGVVGGIAFLRRATPSPAPPSPLAPPPRPEPALPATVVPADLTPGGVRAIGADPAMKVAFVTVYPPRRDGIGDYAAKLVAALGRVDHGDVDVDVYSLARDGVAEEGQRAILSMDPRSWWRLRRELAGGGYDVVHLQFDLSTYLLLIGPLFVILGALRVAGGPRIVATYHDAYADRRLYGGLAVVFYKVFTRVFDRVYVHTRLAEECLVEQYRIAPAKIRRIDHGTFDFANLDRDHDQLRRRWDLGDAPVVLSFGFIYKSKGIEVLIDAVRLLADTGRPLPHVVVAGEPAVRRGIFRVFQARNQRYLDELKAQVQRSGLDKVVTFVGHVPGADLHSLFTLAEVVVLPYLVVDQSGVLNIAIAAHTPVIASDIGGLGETLADVGIVVAPGSAAALADELDRVLGSPDLRARLSDAYAQMAERLSTDGVAVAMVEDYGAICGPRPPRVVQVSAFYPPHLGGQESVVEQLSQALARAGAEVTVISSRLPVDGAGPPDRIPVKRLWAREVAHTPLMPGLPGALALRARGAVVHVHTGQAFVPETVALVCRLLRRPYVCHVHLLVRASGRLGRLLPAYQRVVFGGVLRHAATVACLTEDMRRQVIRTFGVADDRVVVMPNGVDEDWFVSSRRVAQPGEMLFVGRLTVQKNLGVVVRAMAELPDARLNVIGDGEDLPALEGLVATLGLTNVAFLGRRPPAEVRAAMLRASLLVLPSTHEGMPLVLLEAGAAGLPVVASDIPELHEAAPGSRFVPSDDPAAWVAAVRELMADAPALGDMSADGVRRAGNRRWDHLVTQWTDLYARVDGHR